MQGVNFIHAIENDLAKIVATYNATVAGRMVTADLTEVSVESKLAWFKAHNEITRPLWCVMYEGEYAGWLSFQSFYGRPAYNQTAEVSIYLENKFQGKGLGEYCLRYAMEKAPELEIKNILGFIFGHNEPSLKLFYKLGFEKWAHLPKVALMDEFERDLIILGKRIAQ